MTALRSTSYVLATRNGSLYRQHPGKSEVASVFRSRENAEATNASTLGGTGRVLEIVTQFDTGAEFRDGYWTRQAQEG